jgi:hypothetical protein
MSGSSENQKKINVEDSVNQHKKCRLCGGSLPEWWEDVFYWGKSVHRKQCRHCRKCLTGSEDFWGKCSACRDEIWREKERRKEEKRVYRSKQKEEEKELEELERLRNLYNSEIMNLYGFLKKNELLTAEEEGRFVYGDIHFVGDIQGYAGENSNEYQINKLKVALDELSKHKKEAVMTQYRKLRKKIEAMPEYQIWREEVFKKFGRKCAIGPDCPTDSLEVDHRYRSFHSIIKQYGITNTIQAYECAALWDVNNGAPLCREHHSQTSSAKYYKLKNNHTL